MQALAMVSHTGSVFWPPIVKFRGACEIKIKYFPFDDQVSKCLSKFIITNIKSILHKKFFKNVCYIIKFTYYIKLVYTII